MRIEVPDPLIEIYVEQDITDRDKWESRYTASVVVGGVIVMRRVYHNRDADYHQRDYVTDEHEARELCASEFGKVLRSLIGEEE